LIGDATFDEVDRVFGLSGSFGVSGISGSFPVRFVGTSIFVARNDRAELKEIKVSFYLFFSKHF
jgi:hypothetical protein